MKIVPHEKLVESHISKAKTYGKFLVIVMWLLHMTLGLLRSEKLKRARNMFIIKTTVERELLDHVRDKNKSKEVLDLFATLLLKKNDLRLQLLKIGLLYISQTETKVN